MNRFGKKHRANWKCLQLALVTAAILGLAIAVTSRAAPAEPPGLAEPGNGLLTNASAPHLIFVRIIPFDRARQPGWRLENYNGQDILKMIQELKPDVLDRFTTGKPDLDVEVPMGPGSAPMKFADYLTAAMKAGAPGCYLTPKVHLNSIWSDDYRLAAAQALYDLPVTPPLKALDLDCYFSQGTSQEHQRLLQKIKAMGWKDLGFNYAGGTYPTFGLGSYALAGIKPTTGDVGLHALAGMNKEGISIHLAHIDYPGGITEFGGLSPDRQADLIRKISREQHQYGFTFVYPILYSGYDASKQVTRPDGPYKGATVFQVIKQEIEHDRQLSGQ